MHMFHVMGHAPEALTAVVGAIRELPEHCRLVHSPDLLYMSDMETNDYTGELLAAPPGVYNLWQGKVGEPLIITTSPDGLQRKFLMGKHVLLTMDLESDEQIVRVPDQVLDSFRNLLQTSKKRIWVYQNKDKDQQYDIRWPEDAPNAMHPLNPAYLLVGYLDLRTGKVIQ